MSRCMISFAVSPTTPQLTSTVMAKCNVARSLLEGSVPFARFRPANEASVINTRKRNLFSSKRTFVTDCFWRKGDVHGVDPGGDPQALRLLSLKCRSESNPWLL